MYHNLWIKKLIKQKVIRIFGGGLEGKSLKNIFLVHLSDILFFDLSDWSRKSDILANKNK